jgi:RNA polymerase sigma-70 factor (family 1)
MYKELTDESLTALLKSGDPTALETLFRRYYKSLCQYCAIYTKDFAAAEEIVADLFIKLWEAREDSNILHLKNYLFVSARNLAFNHKQKKKAPLDFTEDLALHAHLSPDVNTPFKILSGRESYDRILRVIDTLPERQREVLLLNRVDQVDKHRIAELLGISVRTVETTLYQSIKQLRLLLQGSRNFNPGS